MIAIKTYVLSMFNKLAIAVLKVIGVHCRLYLDTFVLQCFLLFSELIEPRLFSLETVIV
jgi:hypothetical protein